MRALGFLVGVLSLPLWGQTRELARWLEAERERLGVPALQVAAGRDGKVLFEGAAGWADLEHRVAATAETLFRTASIAKPMTAVAVLQLVEAGKLDLDAPIRRYVPAWPPKRWPVTLRQLLCHQGGVRHYRSRAEAQGKEHFFSLAESLRLFAAEPLLFEPGTRFRYTTYGYTLLGLAVAAAAGEPYLDYMEKHVWRPAGMTHTTLDHAWLLLPHRARGYRRLSPSLHRRLAPPLRRRLQPGDLIRAALHDTSMKIPGGGLRSTAGDLVRFGLALLTGKLLKEETRRLMWTEQRTREGEATGYALGFQVRGAVIRHSGAQAGARALLEIHPAAGVVLAAMTNLEGVRLGGTLQRLREQLTER